MLILLDLDGTLVNTVYPDWKTFKDGQENYNRVGFPERIPVFSGAKEFNRTGRYFLMCIY